MDNQQNLTNEITLRDIIWMLWDGKFLVILLTLLTLTVAVIAYLVVPKRYEMIAEIAPLRQSEFTRFSGLIGAESLPYTRDQLFEEFVVHLQSPTLLTDVAERTGVADAAGNPASAQSVSTFVRRISFSRPDRTSPNVRMRVAGGNRGKIEEFVAAALQEANAAIAVRVRDEIIQLIESRKERQEGEISVLDLEIDARRRTEAARRADTIQRLEQQVRIARLLELEKPLEMRPTEAQTGESVSVTVQAPNQPLFFRGYLALEEEIRQLRARTDDDPFVPDLRDLQQQRYLLEQAATTEHVMQALEQSPLSDPSQAKLAHFDLAATTARKTFPVATAFGFVGVMIGLVLGVGVVVARGVFGRPPVVRQA